MSVKSIDRACPSCLTIYRSVQNLGVCPQCGYWSRADDWLRRRVTLRKFLSGLLFAITLPALWLALPHLAAMFCVVVGVTYLVDSSLDRPHPWLWQFRKPLTWSWFFVSVAAYVAAWGYLCRWFS